MLCPSFFLSFFLIYIFLCTEQILQIEGHRITFRSFWKSFFTLPQHLTGACFSIACESCFTRACVRSSSIATHRIGTTAVRVGRTLVDICMRTSKLHRVLESVILYRSVSSYPVDKIVYLFLLLSLFIYLFIFTKSDHIYPHDRY